MSVLQIADIKSSIQAGLIKDEYLKQGQFEFDSRGRLISYTGGFTVVVPIKVQGVKLALRCWYMDLGNVRKRMEALANYLQKQSLPYFCDFSYVDEGIVVDGKVYPITRMKWVDGERLDKYIFSHRDKTSLLRLADNFLSMCKALHTHKIAHGDLQHGNIMVDLSGDIYLIDYDSMFVPTMKGESDIITGLKDYQHPNRKTNLYASEKMDYFSELIIYISILAVAENPDLINKYQIGDTEHLLFTSDDFTNLKKTNIYNDINSLGVIFPLLLFVLEEYLLKNNINDLEPFDELLDRYTKTPVINKFIVENVDNNIVYKNSKITLSWDVTNYNQVRLNGIICKSSKFIDHIETDTIYVLEIINGLKTTCKTLQLKVVEKPDISLKLRPSKLRKDSNEQSQLNWNVVNCISTKLFIDNIEQDVTSVGKEVIKPMKTTTYEIRVVGLDKKTTFSKKITLYVLSESKIEFEANKQYTYPRIPVLLKWHVQHAKFVELVGYGNVDYEGSKIVEVEKDEIFELKVIDAFGVRTKQIHIKVLPLPIIKSLFVPIPKIKHKTSVNFNQTILQPLVGVPTNLQTNINIPPLIKPNYEIIKANMSKPPVFHSLNIALKGKNWWNRIWDRINAIKGFKL